MSNYITITTKSHVDVKAFVEAILESGYGVYPWYGETEFVDGWSLDLLPPSNLHIPFITISTWDANSDSEVDYHPTTLSIDDLVEAYQQAVEGRTETWEDVDADFGDHIIQLAVFGTVVFG